jgi:hypothetical protein
VADAGTGGQRYHNPLLARQSRSISVKFRGDLPHQRFIVESRRLIENVEKVFANPVVNPFLCCGISQPRVAGYGPFQSLKLREEIRLSPGTEFEVRIMQIKGDDARTLDHNDRELCGNPCKILLICAVCEARLEHTNRLDDRPVHDCAGWNRRTVQYRPRAGARNCASKGVIVSTAPIVMHNQRWFSYQGTRGPQRDKRSRLQLIIIVQHANPVARRGLQASVPVGNHPLVFFRAGHANAQDVANSLISVIGRAVISHDDLIMHTDLAEDRLEQPTE